MLLLALFVLGTVRHENQQLGLLEPRTAAAQVTENGVTLTFENDGPTLLTEGTIFTATVAMTPSTEFTMTWDYNINTPEVDVATGVLSSDAGTVTIGSAANPYYYQAAGEYTAQARVWVDGVLAVQQNTTVQVNGPQIGLELSNTTPDFGGELVATVTIDNYVPALFDGVNLDFSDLAATRMIMMDDLTVEDGTATADVTVPVAQTGEFPITATLLLPDGSVYAVEQAASVTVNVNPSVDLTADNTTPTTADDVTFGATLNGIEGSVVSGVIFDFGNDSEPVADNEGPYETTYTYPSGGTYTATARVEFLDSAVYGDGFTSNAVEIIVVQAGEPSLILFTEAMTVTAGPSELRSTTPVTALWRNALNEPVAGELVTVSIESNLGARLTGGVKVISGTTDAEGRLVTNLTGGTQAGTINLVATTGALTATDTVAAELAEDVGTLTLTPSEFETATVGFAQGDRAVSVRLDAEGEIPPGTPPIQVLVEPVGVGSMLAQTTVPTQTDEGELVVLAFDVSAYLGDDPNELTNDALVTFLGSISGTLTVRVNYTDSDYGTLGIVENTLRVRQAAEGSMSSFLPMPNSSVDIENKTAQAQVQQLGLHALTGVGTYEVFLPIVMKAAAE